MYYPSGDKWRSKISRSVDAKNSVSKHVDRRRLLRHLRIEGSPECIAYRDSSNGDAKLINYSPASHRGTQAGVYPIRAEETAHFPVEISIAIRVGPVVVSL